MGVAGGERIRTWDQCEAQISLFPPRSFGKATDLLWASAYSPVKWAQEHNHHRTRVKATEGTCMTGPGICRPGRPGIAIDSDQETNVFPLKVLSRTSTVWRVQDWLSFPMCLRGTQYGQLQLKGRRGIQTRVHRGTVPGWGGGHHTPHLATILQMQNRDFHLYSQKGPGGWTKARRDAPEANFTTSSGRKACFRVGDCHLVCLTYTKSQTRRCLGSI